MTRRRILVTSALPYANGHIHLGHLVEYLQTDMWARFQRMRGHECVYVCADDTHGAAIMIRARQEGRREEDLIAEMSAAHQEDFAAFQIRFDHYGSTNSDANREFCGEFWSALRAEGAVAEREISQLFDPEARVFLADRFVRGTCPKCDAKDQYGDTCEVCGTTYAPTDLIDPKSTLSGAAPELRSAKHLFVDVERRHAFLEHWTQHGEHLQTSVANYLRGHFLAAPLRDWDVSRPAPYFGFQIPDAPGNYWYVWFDAPIGYLASTKEWCERTGQRFEDWWKSSETEIWHFIGKDITYFHTLFWPAMLDAAGYSLPSRVHVHGFLTVNGAKMAKSRGTFVLARTYLEHLDPQYLRYYYAAKLSSKVDDLDLDLDELVLKVNSDLVGKVVNIASRAAKFVQGASLSNPYPDDGGLFDEGAIAGAEIAQAYEACDLARAMRLIMALADRANAYVDQKRPWTLAKTPGREAEAVAVCSVALNLFRQIAVYLTPVLPALSEASGALLGARMTDWTAASERLAGTTVRQYQHLMKRIDPKSVASVIEASREGASVAEGAGTSEGAEEDDALAKEPLAAECTIDDFVRVDLRVARVLSAARVAGSKKLLELVVGVGGDARRTVFAGIAGAYEPEALVGRLVVIAANLQPRRMKVGTSEGMVLAAGSGDGEVFVLSPDSGAKPGQRVH